jgi:hypothetical protein
MSPRTHFHDNNKQMSDWLLFIALGLITLWLLGGIPSIFDTQRQHRTMSSIIERSTRGERERFALAEHEHWKKKLAFIVGFIVVLVLLLLNKAYP